MTALVVSPHFSAPALVIVAGARANPLLGILCLQHPQPAHAPRLCARRAGISRLMRAAGHRVIDELSAELSVCKTSFSPAYEFSGAGGRATG